MRWFHGVSVGVVVLALAGCSDESGKSSAPPSSPPPAANTAPAPAANPPAAAQAEQPAKPAGQAAASKTPEEACLAAVAKETNEPDVVVLSSEFSQANSLVMVGVGAARAPWKCLVSNDGIVAEVSFAGTDGGTPPAAATDANDPAAKANAACLAAVRSETGENDVTILSSEFSEANTLVMVGVGPNRAPWKCLSSGDGTVAEVSSASDEGKL